MSKNARNGKRVWIGPNESRMERQDVLEEGSWMERTVGEKGAMLNRQDEQEQPDELAEERLDAG